MNKKHKEKDGSDEKKAKCEHCFKEFSSLKKLKEHCKHFHGLSLKCEICGATPNSKFEYDEHMLNHGKMQENLETIQFPMGTLLPQPETRKRCDILLIYQLFLKKIIYCTNQKLLMLKFL